MYKSKVFFKKIHKESKFIYWLIKRKYIQSRIYLDIYLSLVFFYCPFLSIDLKIKYLSPKAIPLLSNSLFQKIFNLDLAEYTKTFSSQLNQKDSITIDELTKLSWLIA